MQLLSLQNLHISVGDKEIVRGVDLSMNEGEVHAIMGPNGSGKSTLVHALMGHPAYTITAGSAHFHGKELIAMEPHERAQEGLFLAFQYPREIAGVSLRSFLFAAHNAQTRLRPPQADSGGQVNIRNPDAKHISPIKFKKHLTDIMERLHMDPAFAERAVNKGFSGGEKKKAEVLQMNVLHPVLALLDETDSGLDVDALRVVAEGVNSMRKAEFSALIVTHYARILEYIAPDYVHVMVKGKIVKSGGAELARTLEKEGYKQFQS